MNLRTRPLSPLWGINMVKRGTITMDVGDSTLVFGRVDDVGEALDPARDMGLPLTSPPDGADEILILVRRPFADRHMVSAPELLAISAYGSARLPVPRRRAFAPWERESTSDSRRLRQSLSEEEPTYMSLRGPAP